MTKPYDAIVIGSGPNGLAAAVTLARVGRSVLVLEAQEELGGGARTGELTLPGFKHDLFSAVHPMALESHFLQSLPLAKFGLEWIHSPHEVTHPLESGQAVLLNRSVDETAAGLGQDGEIYRKVIGGLLQDWDYFKSEFLRPVRFPRHPLRLARFGVPALLPAQVFAKLVFKHDPARALFAGIAAHSALPLTALAGSAFGLTLLLAGHHVGWPVPRGGAQAISQALAAYLRQLGGEIRINNPVHTLSELPPARVVLFDLTPRQIVAIAGEKLGAWFTARLCRYRYGPGIFKIDWALNRPIPWTNAAVGSAITVHVGGTLPEIARSERETSQRRVAEKPFTLLAQPSLFDSSRAPGGQHTAWAYCHIPNGSSVDMTTRIEPRSNDLRPIFATPFWPAAPWRPRNWRPATRISSAAISTAVRSACRNSFFAPPPGSIQPPVLNYSSAPRPLLPEAAFTGFAAITPRWRRSKVR
jgi:phytoene dehydrogenase-like protein